MSLMENDTPENDREDSQSALDFAYWMLEYASDSYLRSSTFRPHEGTEDSGENMLQALSFALAQIDISLPTEDYGIFRKRCKPLTITFKKAANTRGALMFRNKGVVMSLGDGKRIMEYFDEQYIVRYLTDLERTPVFWECALVPRMVYV